MLRLRKTTPHTSAVRRFRLPIKGVFPFDAPPRLTFFLLPFFFFSLFSCPFPRLLSSSFHFRVFVRERGCWVFDVSVKGERDVGSCVSPCATLLSSWMILYRLYVKASSFVFVPGSLPPSCSETQKLTRGSRGGE